MSTLRISNIEAKADSSSPTVDEQLRFTNSDGDLMLYLDGRTAGITTVGINTTNQTIKFDANNNVMVTGIITATEFHGTLAVGTSVTYGDNEKAYFGNGLDMSIFHNGNHSKIVNVTGELRLDGDIIKLKNKDEDENYITCTDTAGVELYYANSKKFETTNTGAVVTGILTATGNLHADNYYANSSLTLNNNANVSVNLTSTSTSGSSRIFFGDPDNSLVGRLLYSHNGDYMSFFTAGSERFRIDSNGRVVIGHTQASTNYGKLLHIHNSASAGASLHLTDSTTGTSNSDGFEIVTHSQAAYLVQRENSHMIFMTDGTNERLRIHSSGRLIIGHTSTYPVAGHYPVLQLSGANYNGATLGIINNANDATGAYIQLSKQRSGSPGGQTIVQNDDIVGNITFTAADGTDLTSRIAEIKGMVDGTPGSNDTPGRLSFWTTPDGAQSSLERLRITSSGEILLPAAGANRISMRHSGGGAAVIKNPSAANLSFGTNNQDTEFVIQNGGKVLISNTLGLGGATSNPSGLLHCQAPSGEGLVKIIGATNAVVQISGYNGDSTIQFGDASSDSPGKIKYNHAGDDFIFTAGGNTRGRIYDNAGVTGIEHHQFHPFLIGYNASISDNMTMVPRFGGMSALPIDQDGDKAYMSYATHWRHRQYAGVYFWYGASGNTSGHTFDWDFTVWSATHNEGYSVGSNHTFTIASGTMSNGKMYRLNATSSWPSHHTNELVQFVIEYDEIQNGTSLQLTGMEIIEYTTP